MITRRKLLIGSAVLLAAAPLTAQGYSRLVAVHDAPFQTVTLLYRDLFPGSDPIPSPHYLHAVDYLGGVLQDPYVDEDTKVFIRNGALWLNESAEERYGKPYYALDDDERQNVLQEVAQITWGDNWLWTMFSYLFEALLCDPVYGANTNEAGWQWLGHVPGYPRPKEPII